MVINSSYLWVVTLYFYFLYFLSIIQIAYNKHILFDKMKQYIQNMYWMLILLDKYHADIKKSFAKKCVKLMVKFLSFNVKLKQRIKILILYNHNYVKTTPQKLLIFLCLPTVFQICLCAHARVYMYVCLCVCLCVGLL